MSQTGERFLPNDWHQSQNTLGAVLATFLRTQFPRDTIKSAARVLDCTLPAAANATKGHASERILTKAFQAWPDEFADAVTESFTGLTRAERIKKIIEEEAREHDRRQAARLDSVRLEERAIELLRSRRREAA